MDCYPIKRVNSQKCVYICLLRHKVHSRVWADGSEKMNEQSYQTNNRDQTVPPVNNLKLLFQFPYFTKQTREVITTNWMLKLVYEKYSHPTKDKIGRTTPYELLQK